MKKTDFLYGNFIIDEPVIKELVKSSGLSRLKYVTQNGMPEEYWVCRSYSRYEHSLGVYHLLRKFRATIEEQIVGIIHDIGHLSFSHIAEWVFHNGKDGDESMHDSSKIEHLLIGDLYSILVKYRYDHLLNSKIESRYTLFDKDSPDLCADRLDYSLREFNLFLGTPHQTLQKYLNDLSVHNQEFVFTTPNIAIDYSYSFLKLQTDYYSAKIPVSIYYYFSELLKYSINKGYLKKEDFYKRESYIINKLKSCDDSKVLQELSWFQKQDISEFKNTHTKVTKKFRYIDPKVLLKGKTIRVSDLSKSYAQNLNEALLSSKRGYVL